MLLKCDICSVEDMDGGSSFDLLINRYQWRDITNSSAHRIWIL